jgi:hypothetical protein
MQNELLRGITQDHTFIISVISVHTEITDIINIDAGEAKGFS